MPAVSFGSRMFFKIFNILIDLDFLALEKFFLEFMDFFTISIGYTIYLAF